MVFRHSVVFQGAAVRCTAPAYGPDFPEPAFVHIAALFHGHGLRQENESPYTLAADGRGSRRVKLLRAPLYARAKVYQAFYTKFRNCLFMHWAPVR